VRNILIAMPDKKEKLPLSVTHPELAREADGWDPSTITRGHDKKKPWICAQGHKWNAAPYSRTGTQKRGCPVCAGKKVQAGFNDVATTNPELIAQAKDWDSKAYSAGSKVIVDWECELGHSYSSSIQSRTLKKTGCPVCDGKKTLSGFNDLAAIFPEIANEADGWDPSKVSFGSSKRMKWKCQKRHKWSAVVSDRTGDRKSGCPTCSNHKLQSGYNDLKSKFPKIAREAFGWDPSSELAGSHKKKEWLCPIGHRFMNSVSARTVGLRGCPICANQEVLEGFNDLATTFPEIAAELLESNPRQIISGSRKKLLWKCQLGHTYSASPDSRTSIRKSGCPVCDGKKVLVGFNDLGTTFPEIAKQAQGWDPTTITSGSNRKVLWACQELHTWISTPRSRTKQESECPSCGSFGYDPNDDGYLYFLNHEVWGQYQIGITNSPKQRLNKHFSRGWELIEIRGPLDGQSARDWETAILRMLKANGADLSNEKIAGKFDGYSEAWSKEKLTINSIKELMELTEIFESKE